MSKQASKTFTLAIHGGAGAIGLDDPDKVKKYLDGMRAVLQAGHELLAQGGSCLDAVERCVRMLEDDPQWNAGVGAVMTASGEHELDASIMAGKGRRAGSAAGVKTVRNPISLARAVMEKSPHVMLAGVGADAFAKECKLEIVPNSTFTTEARRQALKNAQAAAAVTLDHSEKKTDSASSAAAAASSSGAGSGKATAPADVLDSKYGTVGCVAMDQDGNIAAGTSTGGMTNKRWGRVGDSPVIGAGTYADNRYCAVSCTGYGEFFIRGVVAYDVAAAMKYGKATLQEAAAGVVDRFSDMGDSNFTGGLIAVDARGNVAMPFNSVGMCRGWVSQEGKVHVAIWDEDDGTGMVARRVPGAAGSAAGSKQAGEAKKS